MPDASPVKWHLAHTTWFFETFVLEPVFSDYRPFHPDFRILFNSYYQTVGAQHPRGHNGDFSHGRAWRRCSSTVDESKHESPMALAAGDFSLPLQSRDRGRYPPRATAPRADPHRYQASFRADAGAFRLRRRDALTAVQPVGSHGWQNFDGGLQRVGQRQRRFCFRQRAAAPPGPTSRASLSAIRLVTNGEYLEFIEDGGYTNPALWLSDGWAVIHERGWDRTTLLDSGTHRRMEHLHLERHAATCAATSPSPI